MEICSDELFILRELLLHDSSDKVSVWGKLHEDIGEGLIFAILKDLLMFLVLQACNEIGVPELSHHHLSPISFSWLVVLVWEDLHYKVLVTQFREGEMHIVMGVAQL